MDPVSPPLWAELFGFLGSSSLGWLDPKKPTHARAYQALNLTVAVGVVVISSMHGNWQPVVLNGFWAVIAVVALIRGPAPE